MDVDGATALMAGRSRSGVGPSEMQQPQVGELRDELTGWLRANLTPEVTAAGEGGLVTTDTLEILREWNRALADAGWAAISWPAEYGGRDATVAEQLAFHEAMAEARAPGPVNAIGVANIAPAMLAFGTADQKARFLNPMLRGDEIWCQGMSEPDAGSDLASLWTTASVRDGGFEVSGQKTWNSLGQYADWCQLFVRTDPDVPKHKGISCLLVDMSSPGVEVRPLRTMTGESTFSEIFFSDVRVPATALLGPVDEGWKVAMTTLSHERAGVARLHLGLSARFTQLTDELHRTGVVATSAERDRLARLYSQISCMRWMTTRELESIGRGGQPSPVMGSLAKLMWAQATQDLADLAICVLGPGALAGPWAHNLLAAPAASIAGGTGDINRNIVADMGLGLPR